MKRLAAAFNGNKDNVGRGILSVENHPHELSDDDLEMIAGGAPSCGGNSGNNNNNGGGNGNGNGNKNNSGTLFGIIEDATGG